MGADRERRLAEALRNLVEQLQGAGYACEAGPLENNAAWHAALEALSPEPPEAGPSRAEMRSLFWANSPYGTSESSATTGEERRPEQCDAKHESWTCKLAKGHSGRHSNSDPWDTAFELAVDVANTETEEGEPSITWLNWFKRGLLAALEKGDGNHG